MPISIENPSQVVKNIKGVHALEQDVAFSIWSFLDQPRFMNELREYAVMALYEMQDVGRTMWTHVISRVEKQLAIYGKMPGKNFEHFVQLILSHSATPGDIADVIRIFGAWVEAGAPRSGDYYRKVENKKPELGHLLGDADTQLHDELFTEKESKRRGPSASADAFDGTHRARGPRQGKEVWKFTQADSVRLSPEMSQYLQREKNSLPGQAFTYVNGGAPVLMSPDGHASAGRLGKGPVGHSTVGRMERVFGLLDLDEKSEGADISGTTADQIFFLQFWARKLGKAVNPTLYLLPLATLVAPYHHSLLEVALTLSYNGIITYVIGQYETLINGASRDHAEVSSFLLSRANDRRNCRMLVQYGNPWSPERCWVYEPLMERQRWMQLANAGDPLLYSKCTHFKGQGGWPNQLDIEKMML